MGCIHCFSDFLLSGGLLYRVGKPTVSPTTPSLNDLFSLMGIFNNFLK